MNEVTRAVWWNVPGWLATLLYLGTAAGLLVSAFTLARRARTAIRGRPIGSAAPFRLGAALRRVAGDVLSHRRILEDPGAGWAHALLFYGFVGLFIGTCLVFVHDRVSGNKLFADKVWYVKGEGGLAAFLLKPAAAEWAKKHGGSVVDYEAARKAAR